MDHLLHSSFRAVRRLSGSPPKAEKPQGSCPASGVRRCAPGVNLFTSWQNERARRVHRICGCIARRRAQGQKLTRAVAYFALYYRARVYRCDPARRFRLTRKTLVRLYYQWIHGGRTLDALLLRYCSGKKKLSAPRLRRFVRASLAPDISSYRLAYLRCGDSRVTSSAYSHALPCDIKKLLRALFAQRRQANRTACALKGVSI
jgi:hypothetical protein